MADVSATHANLSSTESSNAPAGSTAVGTGLDDNLRMMQAHQAAFRDASGWGGLTLSSVAGTNTVTASVAAQGTITMAPTAYATGMKFCFVPANSNTGATTINVNSLGAKNILLNGSTLLGYELRKNCAVAIQYDGSQMHIIGGAYGGDGVPIGTISSRAYATAPTGHLLCDGSAVSRTTYADLFAVLGTTWGTGDGSTTFNIPNLARRVMVGSGGSGTATLSNTVGSTGGEETHTLSVAEMPAHIHTFPQGASAVATGAIRADNSLGATAGQTNSSGGDGAHNNMQPSAVVYMVIKT